MHIFVFRKRFLLFFFCILCLILLILFSFSINDSPILAVSLNSNSSLDENLQDTFNNLIKDDAKIAYLTFDDGPRRKATPKILDILKDEGVKATFFVIGKYVKENPDLIKREYDEGHFIANHGYDHNNSKLYKDAESFRNEILATDVEIGNALGLENYCSHVFRFPNGFMSKNYSGSKKSAVSILKDLNYVYVDWNCLNKDSEVKVSEYQLLNNLKKTSKNKGTLVILMHDSGDVNDTASVLKDSITFLKDQGYEFHNFYDFVNN